MKFKPVTLVLVIALLLAVCLIAGCGKSEGVTIEKSEKITGVVQNVEFFSRTSLGFVIERTTVTFRDGRVKMFNNFPAVPIVNGQNITIHFKVDPLNSTQHITEVLEAGQGQKESPVKPDKKTATAKT